MTDEVLTEKQYEKLVDTLIDHKEEVKKKVRIMNLGDGLYSHFYVRDHNQETVWHTDVTWPEAKQYLLDGVEKNIKGYELVLLKEFGIKVDNFTDASKGTGLCPTNF